MLRLAHRQPRARATRGRSNSSLKIHVTVAKQTGPIRASAHTKDVQMITKDVRMITMRDWLLQRAVSSAFIRNIPYSGRPGA
jgi:hypothetical protein